MTISVMYMTSNYSELSWQEHKVDVSTRPYGVNNFPSVADTPLLPSKAQRKADLGITSELLFNSTHGAQKKLTVMQQFKKLHH